MSRKQQIKAAFDETQRRYQAGDLLLPDGEINPTANWPLHKYAVYVFNDKDCVSSSWSGGCMSGSG